jgi:hypothetical protein
MDLFESATAAAAAIRAREISARELTTALLDRIDAVNPQVNAVIALRRDEALREADAADRTPPVGPLHGVPMTVKDAFHVAGLPTTWGNPAFRGPVADTDATVVARLRAAGAIIVGKTNVAFMLADFGQTTNDVHGTTGNPWDTGRTPVAPAAARPPPSRPDWPSSSTAPTWPARSGSRPACAVCTVSNPRTASCPRPVSSHPDRWRRRATSASPARWVRWPGPRPTCVPRCG